MPHNTPDLLSRRRLLQVCVVGGGLTLFDAGAAAAQEATSALGRLLLPLVQRDNPEPITLPPEIWEGKARFAISTFSEDLGSTIAGERIFFHDLALFTPEIQCRIYAAAGLAFGLFARNYQEYSGGNKEAYPSPTNPVVELHIHALDSGAPASTLLVPSATDETKFVAHVFVSPNINPLSVFEAMFHEFVHVLTADPSGEVTTDPLVEPWKASYGRMFDEMVATYLSTTALMAGKGTLEQLGLAHLNPELSYEEIVATLELILNTYGLSVSDSDDVAMDWTSASVANIARLSQMVPYDLLAKNDSLMMLPYILGAELAQMVLKEIINSLDHTASIKKAFQSCLHLLAEQKGLSRPALAPSQLQQYLQVLVERKRLLTPHLLPHTLTVHQIAGAYTSPSQQTEAHVIPGTLIMYYKYMPESGKMMPQYDAPIMFSEDGLNDLKVYSDGERLWGITYTVYDGDKYEHRPDLVEFHLDNVYDLTKVRLEFKFTTFRDRHVDSTGTVINFERRQRHNVDLERHTVGGTSATRSNSEYSMLPSYLTEVMGAQLRMPDAAGYLSAAGGHTNASPMLHPVGGRTIFHDSSGREKEMSIPDLSLNTSKLQSGELVVRASDPQNARVLAAFDHEGIAMLEKNLMLYDVTILWD